MAAVVVIMPGLVEVISARYVMKMVSMGDHTRGDIVIVAGIVIVIMSPMPCSPAIPPMMAVRSQVRTVRISHIDVNFPCLSGSSCQQCQARGCQKCQCIRFHVNFSCFGSYARGTQSAPSYGEITLHSVDQSTFNFDNILFRNALRTKPTSTGRFCRCSAIDTSVIKSATI